MLRATSQGGHAHLATPESCVRTMGLKWVALELKASGSSLAPLLEGG